jgi:flagellar protein FlgJ
VTGPVTSIGGGAQPQASGKHKQLQQAAQAFESVFLRQMIGSMRQAKLADDDLLGGGSAADQFRDLYDGHIADSMSSKGGFGIAAMLLKQFEGNAPAAGAGAPAGTAASAAPNGEAATGKAE